MQKVDCATEAIESELAQQAAADSEPPETSTHIRCDKGWKTMQKAESDCATEAIELELAQQAAADSWSEPPETSTHICCICAYDAAS